MSRKTTLCILAGMVCSALSAADYRGTLIVLPSEPTISERFAAKELKYHLEKATGRVLRIVSESSGEEGRGRFFVGNVKALRKVGIDYGAFKPEERLVKGVAGDVFLAGGGTLYAVYDFLEKDMGVKWLWPGELGEVIPEKAVPSLDGTERRGIEPLVRRTLRGNIETFRRIFIANRLFGWDKALNARREVELRELWMTRNRLGSRKDFRFGHAFTHWHKIHKDHPEYFAMQPSGLRGTFSDRDMSHAENKYYPICVSNPDVHDAIVDEWAKEVTRHLKKGWSIRAINLCENDAPGFCVCANCRAWDADDPGFKAHPYWNGQIKDVKLKNRFFMAKAQWGDDDVTVSGIEPPSVTDRYVKFYNAVLAKARKRHPSAEVCAYAYSNYVQPPRETRVSDGVIISFVPAVCFPYGAAQSEDFRKRWDGWNRMGAGQMFYRPNYMHAGGLMPYSHARRMAEDINYAWARGMIAVDQDSLNGVWSAQALKNYVAARILREPDAPFEKMFGEFLSAFGAGAGEIRRYCDMLEALNDVYTKEEWDRIGNENRTLRGAVGGGWCRFVMNIADLYSEKWFAEADALLAAAESKTSGAEKERVAFLRKGLKNGLLTYRTRVAQKSGDEAAFRKAFRELADYRKSVEADNVCAWSVFADREKHQAGWPQNSLQYYLVK